LALAIHRPIAFRSSETLGDNERASGARQGGFDAAELTGLALDGSLVQGRAEERENRLEQ
jgi:hypothetical protein